MPARSLFPGQWLCQPVKPLKMANPFRETNPVNKQNIMKKQNSTRRLCFRALFTAALALIVTVNARAGYQSTVLGDNPLAYYALDLTIDNSGTATDLSGNGNNSSYSNIYPAPG